MESENRITGNNNAENISDCVSFDNTQKLEKETLEAEELCTALNNWFSLGESDKTSKSLYYRVWKKDAQNTEYPVLSKNTPKILTKVEINTLPDKCIYIQGESFDKTGLTLLAKYANGETSVIGEDELEIGVYDFSTQGSKTVEVHYNRFTVEILISVNTASESHNHIEVVDKAVAPTCTQTGLTEGKHCSECGEIVEKQEKVQALGHNFINGVCSRCNSLENSDNNIWNDDNQNANVNDMPTGNTKPTEELNIRNGLLKGTILKDRKNEVSYRVLTQDRVEFYKVDNKETSKITIPSAVSMDRVKFKVTDISDNAFNGCKKLKSITIKTKKLNSKSVGAQAFKGLYKKAVIKVPKKQKKAYTKWLKKKGITKKMKIK